jgi:hypothetical protein
MNIEDTYTRPWVGTGDAEPHQLFYSMGQAVASWEMAEQSMAELADAIRSKKAGPAESDRAAFIAFVDEPAGTKRIVFLKKMAAELSGMSDFKDRLLALVKAAFQLCDRRNQIAHGMVMNLGPYGYCLGPSNLQKTRWEREGVFGAAEYQYVGSDVAHYANQFGLLQAEADRLRSDIQAFNSGTA